MTTSVPRGILARHDVEPVVIQGRGIAVIHPNATRLLLLTLLVAVIVAALGGGWAWDDPSYATPPS
jgi:hypothetical protein